jgi:DNA (cytosine-5)-methyltransferase 1
MNLPLLLDLCCCAGGGATGYARAGYAPYGIDIGPQPRYPFPFLRMDALEALRRLLAGEGLTFSDGSTLYLPGFDVIHASPPCQGFSRARLYDYPDILTPARPLLQATGLPYVIENVPGAPMRADLRLCACMFPELDPILRRERWFETSVPIFDLRPPCRHPEQSVSVNRRGGRYNGPGPRKDTYIPLAECQRLMGIGWTSQNELGEAIPPPYTEYIGAQLMDHLKAVAA